jgi:DNA-binding LacI/PurR family transcriptional regulator
MAKRKTKKVKLLDIARVAKVSASTVSRVTTGRTAVTPEIRDRVIKAAVELGFELDRRKESRIIAFLLSNRGVLHPFHSSVLMGAEAYCADHDYGLLFLPFAYSSRAAWNELRLPSILGRPQIASGVIVAGTNSQNLLDFLTRDGVPWVVLGNNVTGEWDHRELSAVFFDDVGGAYELTRYLIALGHRQIGFAGNLRLPWFARRYQGYSRAIEEAGLEPRLSDVNSVEGDEIGYLAAKLMLQWNERASAIFAGDDRVARGAYQAVRDRGLDIPGDISVAGFNDTSEAAALLPPLTSVRVFAEQLGKQLAELLLKKIARPDLKTEPVLLPTQLIKRESCATPSTGGSGLGNDGGFAANFLKPETRN